MRLSLILLAVVLAAPQVLAQDTPSEEAEPAGATLIATLDAAGRFTTLLGALEATNLVETLQGEGPFTLFAPTDEAFAALPEGTLEALTPEQLQGILLYHVVAGAVDGATASAAGEAPTAWGENVLTFTPTEAGGLMVNDASVTEADMMASNGVIHVVDGVLLPPPAEAEDMEDMDHSDGDMDDDGADRP